MSFVIFLGLGFGVIAWGLKAQEEIAQLSAVILGAILLMWGLCLTPQKFLLVTEILTVIMVFRGCIRCWGCDQ
ncbi:hypothetical protein [Pleurocapsa sp. PCC 7319]|uniref:hypothetical protein n=1 Tax=Pleurocapsa sp. PCC 7319 TaxID=118161 RepID=UPI0003494A2B|nr:hypothetical protein [Pleurocapsa sp. PCC 7319]